MEAGVSGKVGIGQPEERRLGAQTALLKMNKSAGQLDKALVKRRVRPLALAQPEGFQHLVRLVKQALVEAPKEPQVPRIQALSLEPRSGGRDAERPRICPSGGSEGIDKFGGGGRGEPANDLRVRPDRPNSGSWRVKRAVH